MQAARYKEKRNIDVESFIELVGQNVKLWAGISVWSNKRARSGDITFRSKILSENNTRNVGSVVERNGFAAV